MKGDKTVWKPAYTTVTSHTVWSFVIPIHQDAAVSWLVEAKPHHRGIWSSVPFPRSAYTTLFLFPLQPLLQCHLPNQPSRVLKRKRAEGNALLCQAAGIRGLNTLHKAGIDAWAAIEFLCKRLSFGDGWNDSYLISFPMGWKPQYKCKIYNQWGTTYGASKEFYNLALSDFI